MGEGFRDQPWDSKGNLLCRPVGFPGPTRDRPIPCGGWSGPLFEVLKCFYSLETLPWHVFLAFEDDEFTLYFTCTHNTLLQSIHALVVSGDVRELVLSDPLGPRSRVLEAVSLCSIVALLSSQR